MARLIGLLLAISFSLSGWAQSLSIKVGASTFESEVLVKNRKIPWDLVWGADQALWFTEKAGSIHRLDPATGKVQTLGQLADVYVSTIENSGLHSMALHPAWPDSNFMIIHYCHQEFASKIVRLTIDLDRMVWTNEKTVLPELKGARSHNGSRITTDSSGHFLISIGDAYLFDPAQDTQSLNGKVLRFSPWGSVPDDNPFPGSYVWSMGHRNPQGLVYASNHRLYESEHGPTTDDELNIILKGGNYGWPKITGFADLPSEQHHAKSKTFIDPSWTWTPTAAPSGLDYYSSDYFPELTNSLLQCFLKGRGIATLPLNPSGDSILDQQIYFENDYYRIRDVAVSDDGSLYFSTSNLEVSQPPTFPEDDKIIHVTNPEKTGKHNVFKSIEVNRNKLQVRVQAKKPGGRFYLSTFYGKEIEGFNLPKNKQQTFEYQFTEAGRYWLKFKADDKIYFRLIEVNDLP